MVVRIGLWCKVIPGKSIVPLLSASTSLIMSCSSDSLGFWPRDRMTVPSSFVVICPKRRWGQLAHDVLAERASLVSVAVVEGRMTSSRFPRVKYSNLRTYGQEHRSGSCGLPSGLTIAIFVLRGNQRRDNRGTLEGKKTYEKRESFLELGHLLLGK